MELQEILKRSITRILRDKEPYISLHAVLKHCTTLFLFPDIKRMSATVLEKSRKGNRKALYNSHSDGARHCISCQNPRRK